MKIYDISLPVSGDLIIWPGDTPVTVTPTSSITKGDKCNVSCLKMGMHTGTHIDAPYHFLKEGGTTDSIPIDTFIGKCVVVEANGNCIEKEDFQSANLNEINKILFKTRNSKLWTGNCPFDTDYVYLGIDAARYLVELNIRLVGIDYLSIEDFKSEDNAVHKLLLQNNVVILEGLNLAGITPGTYELICLPLKLQGCDGAPARVILKSV